MDIIALDVRLDGFDDPIGNLVRDEEGALAFAYRSQYLDNSNAIPLSLSLPLTDATLVDPNARPFFDNLLQERDGPLQRVMDREGLARSDVAGLLFHLGRGLPGIYLGVAAGSARSQGPGEFPDRLPSAGRSPDDEDRPFPIPAPAPAG